MNYRWIAWRTDGEETGPGGRRAIGLWWHRLDDLTNAPICGTPVPVGQRLMGFEGPRAPGTVHVECAPR